MKLVAPFETSMERTEARRILLVQVNVDGVTGWAECVAGESPYYSPEMIDTAWFIFRDFLWPLIKGKEFATANDVWDLLKRVRGHNMARAALEAAVWDAEAQQKGIPLSKLIGGVREEIACGVSVGIKESLDELAAAVQKELAALRETDTLTPDLVFRDPYFLDFLGLADTYSEKDLETAILRELQS